MAHMEDILDLYAEPYDPQRPVVCFDETSTQLLADVREPLPAKPGKPRREDYEYRREGTRNLFLFCEPLAGWRHVEVTQRRTTEDFAHQMRLAGGPGLPRYPGGPPGAGQSQYPPQGVAVSDLSGGGGAAHSAASGVSLHAQAWQLVESCPELVEGTAEIEFSVFSRSCLRQRFPDEESLCREVQALELERNQAQSRINWRFGILDARTKLHRLYPIHS